MSSTLKEQLALLHKELSANPAIDDEAAAMLRQLARDIETVEPAAAASVTDGLDEAVGRFDAEHPSLTAILRQIVDTLQKMGV